MFHLKYLGESGIVILALLTPLTPLVAGGHINMRQYNQGPYALEIGEFGDASSIGSMGFRVEIRTHIYQVNAPNESDDFVVGANLADGASIEFGYQLLSPGIYCNSGDQSASQSCVGSTTFNESQPNWYWEYDFSSRGYYYGSSGLSALDVNASWHTYAILPNPTGGWAFEFDGQKVATAQFPLSTAADRVYAYAGKISASSTPGSLGPVEFRNLAYLKQDGWHSVEFLYALVACAAGTTCPANPYGVSLLGINHIIAGSSLPQMSDGQLLSMNMPGVSPETATLLVDVADNSYAVIGVSAVIAALAVALIIRRRRNGAVL